MRKLTLIIASIVLVMVFFGCKKDQDLPNNVGATTRFVFTNNLGHADYQIKGSFSPIRFKEMKKGDTLIYYDVSVCCKGEEGKVSIKAYELVNSWLLKGYTEPYTVGVDKNITIE